MPIQAPTPQDKLTEFDARLSRIEGTVEAGADLDGNSAMDFQDFCSLSMPLASQWMKIKKWGLCRVVTTGECKKVGCALSVAHLSFINTSDIFLPMVRTKLSGDIAIIYQILIRFFYAQIT